jgi:predicted CXXCH cytochrome family protein
MLRMRPNSLLSPRAVAMSGFLVVLALGGCSAHGSQNRGAGTAEPAKVAASASTVLPQPRQALPPGDLARFVGSARCIACHPNEAGQAKSRHARTLSRTDAREHARRFRQSTPVLDPLEGVEYRPAVAGGQCVLQVVGAGQPTAAPADYAFGSGSVAVTYVCRRKGASTELRLTHYSSDGKWGFTPGQRIGRKGETPEGTRLDARTEEACFSCHSTVLAKENGVLDPERSILGIGCEACHGAGAEHVEAVRRGARDLRMPALEAERQRVSLELCGSCHRAPGSVDLGSPAIAGQLPRLQSVALSLSDCFKKGGVSCMTCHDPHENAGATLRVDYNRKCLSCHAEAAPKQIACTVEPRGDCVSCHMPAQDIEMPGAIRFRNHWIKVWR